ncbi:rRNA maturation RNase YbeY [Flavobacterium psychrophilum]|uniref:rRNA maturation RNase YbeY n=1 Tax=Flavobacterium psychrophilum TaxID=96345 RepID=UPI000B7C34FC|nr:rRNA maturation RNase YbeY [Flavobacterium psychrophilum]QRE61606.1 rRNA maturation RNase YbeY [Flavobacterium psychrophilum]QRE63796.1 rRNA maturation RNase YbeY [Flavobacterium psychrophilum]SNB34114.1 Endoribonuclease YbeY [Flavobacterium psychrophilum]SNB39119.1 Endoribonuclease YbeY [Flavobacterium psychrophilum]
MISFNYEIDFEIQEETSYTNWVSSVILSENKSEGEINYIFCDDNYLLEINQQYLNHDTLTDIISFDYSLGDEIHGDIYISIERVRENADDFKVPFEEELKRVMIHGVLHYCGYKDKSDADELLMRSKEDEKLKLFHVKQN